MATTDETTQQQADDAQASPDEIVFLEPGPASLRLENNRLQLKQDRGEEWTEISLARLFPFSQPDEWISVLDKDGKEIGIIRAFKDLPRELVPLIRRELDRRYMVPCILHIFKIKQMRGILKMSVETDRGRRIFFLRNLNENIQQPFPGYLTMTDVDNNRYDIPDISALDSDSRRLLDICL